jgi:hypothetical protein
MMALNPMRRHLLLLAFLSTFHFALLHAQSDSIDRPFSSLKSSTSLAPLTSFLDSSLTIWGDLLQSLFQDTTLLSDTARRSFYMSAQSIDSLFLLYVLNTRARLMHRRHSDSLSTTVDSLPTPLLTAHLKREQAHLADTMLTLYDSLSRAFDTLLTPKPIPRENLSTDYKYLLDNLLENRTRAHRFYFSTAYQSRSVWRGIEQNSGNGAYSLSGTYQHRTGIFLSASVLGLQGQPQAIDQLSLALGIDYTAFENLFLSLAYTRYHYSDSSVQARASINSDLSLWLSYPTTWLTPSLTLIWAMGENDNDFFCDWEISRTFLLLQSSSSKLALTPSLRGEYGTISNVRAIARRVRPNQPLQTSLVQSSPFVLTNYNLSLSLLYSIGSFHIVPEFLFVVPINVSSLTITRVGALNPILSNSRTFSQGGSSFGYFSVSFSYLL